VKRNKNFLFHFRKKLIFIFPIALAVFIWQADIFKIKNVICRINEQPCPMDVWADLTRTATRENIIFLSTQKLARQLEKKIPLLETVKIKKIFPDKILFEFRKRSAAAAIKVDGQKRFLIVDEDGFLLEKVKKTNLPIILTDQSIGLSIGGRLDRDEVVWTIALLKNLKLKLLEPQVTKIVSPRRIELTLKGGPVVVFSSRKEAEIQLDSLQFIFSRAKIEGKRISKIDLRFDKPVAVYE